MTPPNGGADKGHEALRAVRSVLAIDAGLSGVRCNLAAEAVIDALNLLPVEQRMEAMGMRRRRWHFAMDFDPHEECNDRCRWVYEEAPDGNT